MMSENIYTAQNIKRTLFFNQSIASGQLNLWDIKLAS